MLKISIIKHIVFVLFFAILCTANIPNAFAENTVNRGVSVNPAKIDIIGNELNYQITLTNNYEFSVAFNIYFDRLHELEYNLSNQLSLVPYSSVDTASLILEHNQSRILKLNFSPDIRTLNNSLYGTLVIATKYKNIAEATINQAIAVPIYRNNASVLGTSTSNKGLKIENIQFDRSLLSISNTAHVTFNIVNNSDSIQRIYGEYNINDLEQSLYYKSISENNYLLYPNQTQKISEDIDMRYFINAVGLNIDLYDSNHNTVDSAYKKIILISFPALIFIITIILSLLLIAYKLPTITKTIKKTGVRAGRSGYKFLIKTPVIFIILSVFFMQSLNTVSAQSLSSPSYRIPSSDFLNGNNSTSTTYRVRDEQGVLFGNTSTSASYGAAGGLVPLNFAFVPTAPLVSNNSGTYYDQLSLILSNTGSPPSGNPADTQFAVIVTSPSFAGNKYVQSDNSLGTSLDNNTSWRKYNIGSPNWGGTTGINVTGLQVNTSYTFYVKARHRYAATCSASSCNIPSSETAVVFNPASNATPSTTTNTTSPTLSFQILALASGTQGATASVTNTVTSNTNSVNFGTVLSGSLATASNTLRVTTNAKNGFKLNMNADQRLQSNGSFIDWFAGGCPGTCPTFAAPQNWSSPTGTYPNAAWAGYQVASFTGTKFAPFLVAPSSDQIINVTSPQTNTANDNIVSYRIEVNASQPFGSYSGMTITYVLTGSY